MLRGGSCRGLSTGSRVWVSDGCRLFHKGEGFGGEWKSSNYISSNVSNFVSKSYFISIHDLMRSTFSMNSLWS